MAARQAAVRGPIAAFVADDADVRGSRHRRRHRLRARLQPPLPLTGTAAIIVLLFLFRNAPVGVEAGTTAIRQIDPAIEEGSASLGARPMTTFGRVVLPLIAPAFFTGLAHSFVRCMTAISAVIFVVSGQWNLVTVSILGFVENSDLARASALCMVLVAIVSGVLALLQLALANTAVRR
jgi:iron(III) transport system permease protein